jgi:hypothetical protein
MSRSFFYAPRRLLLHYRIEHSDVGVCVVRLSLTRAYSYMYAQTSAM